MRVALAPLPIRFNNYKILIGKPEGKRSLSRPWYRWDNNNEIDLKTPCEDVDYIHLAQNRAQWQTVMKMVCNFLFDNSWGISLSADLPCLHSSSIPSSSTNCELLTFVDK
jgi:hypothetical protein